MPEGFSFYLPLWGLISVAGVAGWQFGFKLIGAGLVIGGLMMGGFINF